nr:MAG TPA: hypothetical protein [Caudoviricetes sp.]
MTLIQESFRHCMRLMAQQHVRQLQMSCATMIRSCQMSCMNYLRSLAAHETTWKKSFWSFKRFTSASR